MIKYLVHTVSSLRDYNGNCYHFARITSTKTKKSLVIDGVGGSSNASALLFRKDLVKSWEEVYVTEQWEGKREWKRMQANASSGLYEHNVTLAMIRALNRKS